MSYGWMVYAVDLARVDGTYGSKDEALLSAMTSAVAEDPRERDLRALQSGAPPAAEALRRIVAGEPLVGDGAPYAYAYERVCKYLGKALDNSRFYPCNLEYLRELDAVFARHAVPLRLASLVYGERPSWLPPAGDFPGVGRLTVTTALDARTALNGHVRNRIMDEETEAVYEATEQVFEWLVEAIGGGGLVLFYY